MLTSAKLRALAAVVTRNRRFDLLDVWHCIFGIGERFNPETNTFSRPVKHTFGSEESIDKFVTAMAVKYGLSGDDARLLFIGRNRATETVVPFGNTIANAKKAGELLRSYADLYEAAGN